jgi:hypothetical protein
LDVGVLLGDGHNISNNVEHALETHPDAIGGGGPRDGETRHGDGLPRDAGLGRHVDGHAVDGELEAVDIAVPLDSPLGTHVEAVVVGEADAERLDPGEVAAHGQVALTNER